MRKLILILLLVLLAGCTGGEVAEQSQPLPTPFPSPTVVLGNPDDALRVADEFLLKWREGDLRAMYSLLSVNAQQATDFETFRDAYNNAQRTMRLDSLDYTILVQHQDSHRLTEFIYDVTFNTRLVGSFSDKTRRLLLIQDAEAGNWRVAWSPADIFAEMGGGGMLRMESFVPQRANIYDRNGNILADMNGVLAVVNVIPGQIPDRAACVNTLATMLNRTPGSVEEQLRGYHLEQLGEVGTVEPAVYYQWSDALERDCAARFDHRPTRRYINGELMAHIIGSVGYPDEASIASVEAAGFQQDSILGQAGIERTWDETLRGQPGGRLSIVTPDGQQLRVLAESAPQPAQSIYLTLDSDLQRFTLRAINEAYSNAAEWWGGSSKGAAAVVMDVRTGEILAMVSYPTFNANAFLTFPPMGQAEGQAIVRAVQADPRQPQVNRVTHGEYPNGSTMKIVSTIAAWDSGVWGMDERYNSTGIWRRDIPRRDWLAGGHGNIDLGMGLTVSCNTCFYEVGYRLDQHDPWLFFEYASRLGFNRGTGMTDLDEVTGLIGNPANKQSYEPTGVDWNFSDAVSIAIGQGGVRVTPLQQVRIMAMVANGGTLYRPTLVQRAGLLDSYSYEMEPLGIDAEIDPLVIERIQTGLCGVTTLPSGTATHIFRGSPLLDIGVCGKTGTGTAGRGDVLPHAWFNAYAPMDNPEIAIVVLVENAGDGSAVAAPITRRILEYYFYGME